MKVKKLVEHFEKTRELPKGFSLVCANEDALKHFKKRLRKDGRFRLPPKSISTHVGDIRKAYSHLSSEDLIALWKKQIEILKTYGDEKEVKQSGKALYDLAKSFHSVYVFDTETFHFFDMLEDAKAFRERTPSAVHRTPKRGQAF